jgi:hypothetical protein
MCQSSSGTNRVQKWYNKNIFPLVPVVECSKADEHNTSSFSFRWLFFTMWTIDEPCFEVSIVTDTHWGVGVTGLFPYFRWCVSIPCPENIGMWIHRNFSRCGHK